MKPLITILLLLITPALSSSLEFIHSPTKPVVVEVDSLQVLWESICIVESGGNDSIINTKEMAYGIAQIRDIRLKDYYNHTGIRYELEDMLDSANSREVFMFYAYKNLSGGLEGVSRRWNGGRQGMNKASTIKYFKKVNQLLKEQS